MREARRLHGAMFMLVTRRRSLRIPCHLRAVWMHEHGGTAVVSDMSARGMFLVGCTDVAPGRELDVAVRLDDVSVACTVRVRFVGETRCGRGCGVEILEMLAADRQRWLVAYRRTVEDAIGRVPGEDLRRASFDGVDAEGER